MIDRRKEFKKRMWSQGMVLDTQITREFSNEQFIENMEEEKRCCLVDFQSIDEGRSRILI